MIIKIELWILKKKKLSMAGKTPNSDRKPSHRDKPQELNPQ